MKTEERLIRKLTHNLCEVPGCFNTRGHRGGLCKDHQVLWLMKYMNIVQKVRCGDTHTSYAKFLKDNAI